MCFLITEFYAMNVYRANKSSINISSVDFTSKYQSNLKSWVSNFFSEIVETGIQEV